MMTEPIRRLADVLVPAAAALLAGCTLAPQYVRPVPPIPARFPTEAATSMQSAQPVTESDWCAFFLDPALQALIERALNGNRDLRAAAARIEQARAQYRIQRSARFPDVGADAAFTRSRTPADLSLIGRPVTASDYQVTVGAAWELDFWGRIRSLSQAAREQFLATAEARRGVALSLVAQVASGVLLDRELTERLALADRTITARQESARIARRRFEVGSAARLDMVQAESLLAQARVDRLALAQARDQNRNALALLVGGPVEDTDLAARTTGPAVRIDLPAGLPSELMVNRPDILAAEHRLRATIANIGAARAAFFPSISLTGAFGTASAELTGLFAGGSQVWSISPGLSLPLFNAGRNRANLALTEAQRTEAVAAYEATVQAAFRDVADALAARRWLAGQVEAQQATLAALTERARLADLRYRSGAAAYLEVLDAQRDLFTAEQALVRTRRELASSGVELYAALGGALAPARGDDNTGGSPR